MMFFHHNPRVRGSSPCAATKLLLSFAYFYKPLRVYCGGLVFIGQPEIARYL